MITLSGLLRKVREIILAEKAPEVHVYTAEEIGKMQEEEPTLEAQIEEEETAEAEADKEAEVIKRYLKILDELLTVKQGRQSPADKVKMFFDPPNPLTSSILDPHEIKFVSHAYWYRQQWKAFQPLKELADILLLTKLSHKGAGIDNMIKALQAMAAEEFRKSGVYGTVRTWRHPLRGEQVFKPEQTEETPASQ